MASKLITRYDIGWHPTRGGYLRFEVEGEPKARTKVISPADLAAVAAVLSHKPVYFDLEQEFIHTGPEAPGPDVG